MINAAAHPGPALWQGLMLIVVSIWALFVFTRKNPPSQRAMWISTIIVVIIGISLFVVIINWPAPVKRGTYNPPAAPAIVKVSK